MPARLSFVTLDVFTDSRYAGNPLAIVHVPGDARLSQNQKQRIARELNLSETVFLHDRSAEDGDGAEAVARIDIFTPAVELPFAGHPTIGTANYLLGLAGDAEKRRTTTAASATTVRALQLKAGRFPITPKGKGAQTAVAHDVHTHAQGRRHLFSTPHHDYPVVSIVNGMTFVLAQLDSLDELGDKRGSLVHGDALSMLDEGWRNGIVATYYFVDLGEEEEEEEEEEEGDEGNGDEDGRPRVVRRLRTRMFGSREDAATGSAACALAAYLALREGRAGRRCRYHLTQGVEMGRPSQIHVEVVLKEKGGGAPAGEVEVDQVLLSGRAVLNMEGTLCVPI